MVTWAAPAPSLAWSDESLIHPAGRPRRFSRRRLTASCHYVYSEFLYRFAIFQFPDFFGHFYEVGGGVVKISGQVEQVLHGDCSGNE